MNAMYLIYVPVAVLFAVFVIYAGLIMPAKEIGESLRGREEPRGPDAEVLPIRPSASAPAPNGDDNRKVAA